MKQEVSLLLSIEDSFIANSDVVVTDCFIDLTTDLLIDCYIIQRHRLITVRL